ncbi:MAG: dihydroorotate dehydrogenase (quinone) [Betaproteobacteria bacterium RIFCSPLOWO2_02_FULL_65_24]|nr:MAG: dihydroorotate dehydrogenase (quinone) [Betaproteobacteria bacterium RIFCSPLOWO2_02_FULL_65_24]OGA96332.1 MAG: dihydroorotate dehydrogenase (quinone) [Betaproteobacteria bacterium RIFCSPLOWO2_12_FULL_66_14]
MSFYRWCVRPFLFQFDPEWIHHHTLLAARAVGRPALMRKALTRLFEFDDPRLHVSYAGLDFPNPVGLPGGFDKNGLAIETIATAGFGFLEVGSVSLHPSAGNPERPRLFRLPLDESIMIYYGVPNEGADAIAKRLTTVRLPAPLGINVVETNTGRMAPTEEVIEELAESVRPFLGMVDYIVINMNCPNSMGGASVLDEPKTLQRLLESYRERYPSLPPMFLKINVPLEAHRIDAVLEVTDSYPFVKGFIPSAGKKPPSSLRTPREQLAKMRGSVTGPHTREGANEIMRAWYARIDPSRYILVSAGGIFSAEDAYERIRAGASLVQVYTALIYRGPGLVKNIKQGLCALLERDGLKNISEAVGIDHARRAGKSVAPGAATSPMPAKDDAPVE